MIRSCTLGLLAVLLAGCGSDTAPPAIPFKAILTEQVQKLMGKGRTAAPAPMAEPDPAILAEGRRVLQEGGQPVMSVTDRALGLAAFMVPLGDNSGVVTWANPEYQTIAMRDGVILATRGFGTDMMSAEVPTAALLRSGSGTFRRVHYVLDGADQTQKQVFDCTLSISNNEIIKVLDLSYSTLLVTEDCMGTAGQFANSYWFDDKGIIRQSRQVRAVGVENLQLQAIID